MSNTIRKRKRNVEHESIVPWTSTVSSIESMLEMPPRNQCAHINPITHKECQETGIHFDPIQSNTWMYCPLHIHVSDNLLDSVRAKIGDPFLQQMYKSLKKVQDLDKELKNETDKEKLKPLAKQRYMEASNWFIGTHPDIIKLFHI